MELGKRLKAARLEAGLSQRQLCGDTITRNMLSQIENGTATPSMQTLRILAERLGKPLSCFLDEDPMVSANRPVMERARKALEGGTGLLEALSEYKSPDPVFDPEYRLLQWLALLESGEAAAKAGRQIYARELLRRAEELETLPPLRALPEISRRRVLIQSGVEDPGKLSLPPLDGELILRAKAAKDPERAAVLLDACEDRETPAWNLLRGEVCVRTGDWAAGERYLHKAEAAFPEETAPLLEQCCREQGDFRGAYFYACCQRNNQ